MDYSERLINATIRIGTESRNGLGYGTGFFFSFQYDDVDPTLEIDVIITNKHVVEGAERIFFYVKSSTPELTPIYEKSSPIVAEEVTDFLPHFIIEHPEQHVDLVAIPVKLLRIAATTLGNGREIYYDKFGESSIPTKDAIDSFRAIEEIYMAGYPDGLWDERNNLPIVRKGMTATHPAIDYDGEKEFLIDIAAFAGSSGSPVFMYHPHFFPTKSSLRTGGGIYLLGVEYAGPEFEVEGQVITKTLKPSRSLSAATMIPMNLAYVVKSEKIMDLKPLVLSAHYTLKGGEVGEN